MVADRGRDESGCLLRYEWTFMRPLAEPLILSAQHLRLITRHVPLNPDPRSEGPAGYLTRAVSGRLVVNRSLPDGQVLVPGGVQFVVGGVLQGEQGTVGAGNGQQDLVELALAGALMTDLAVLDDEDHGQGDGGDDSLEDGLPAGPGTRPRC